MFNTKLTVHQAACYWQNQPQLSTWYMNNHKALDVGTATSSYNKVMKLAMSPNNTAAKMGAAYVTAVPSIVCNL